MNKDIYLLRGAETESYRAFQERMFALAGQVVTGSDPWKLSMTITTETPPVVSVIPFRKRKIAAFSVFRADAGWLPVLTDEPGFCGAYHVEVALPVAYEKSWKDGEITPGVCLLTLFKKKPGLDRETFLHRWHNSHTPLSLKIHPLWHYSRNVVLDSTGVVAGPWDGIVEEHVRNRAALLNPFRFFGPFPVILPRMLEVYRDTRSFLDYGTIEPYLVQEWWFRT
jgi:hypothetical protein